MHHLPVPQSWSLWAFQVPEMPLHPHFLLLHPRLCPPLCILALCLGGCDGTLRNVTKDPGCHSGELRHLVPWSCLSGPLVLVPSFSLWYLLCPLHLVAHASPLHFEDFNLLFSSQLSWYQVPYVIGKRHFLTQPEVQVVSHAQLVNKCEICSVLF